MAFVKCIRNLVSSTVPDGKTVTPTDDIATWLACGGRSESYTTLSQVLADVACLSALINDNNAVDYLVRSTTWASDVCGDSSAMSYIGLNNYASNTLLADATWCSAICNSTYFESVLNVKVPVMTSNTTPSGEVIFTALVDSTQGWYAFDGNDNTDIVTYGATKSTSPNIDKYIGYVFTTGVKVYRADATKWQNSGYATGVIRVQSSADGITWVDASSDVSFVSQSTRETQTITVTSTATHRYWRLYTQSGNRTGSGSYIQLDVTMVQFYGRADI